MQIPIIPPAIAMQYPAGTTVRLADVLDKIHTDQKVLTQDEIAANQRRYYEEHKDEIAANQRRYYEAWNVFGGWAGVPLPAT